MKTQNLQYIILLFLVHIIFITNAQTFDFGVNLAGAEFDEENMPGVFGQNYVYPNALELDYYNAKGLKLIRLPFRWERIQQTLNGNLDVDELNRLKQFVQQATNRNMFVLLDLHNSARYRLNNTDVLIGTGSVTTAHVKDLWIKLADEFKNETNIWGYGIMNEPYNMLNNTQWFNIAQEIINGIRTVDLQTPIIVGGDSYSSAERWLEFSDNLRGLIDISNKIIFEAHVYFDDDASGQYLGTYDEELATPNIGIDRVQPFIDWLQSNNFRGYIGEYGIPDNDTRWLTTLNNFLTHLNNNCINGTYWAGGPRWGPNFMAIDPIDNTGESDPLNGTERPQMAIVQNFTLANSNCTYLSIQEFSNSENVIIYPNPTINIVIITSENIALSNIKIYSLIGQDLTNTIKKQLVNNTTVSLNLSRLQKGLYLIKNKSTITKILKK